MNLEELFKQRLLRRIPPDEDKVRKSLETAEMFFQKIKPLQQINEQKLIIFTAYTAMFHAARALLYKDGIQEKSHYAVFVYLETKYKQELGENIYEFNVLRKQRHTSLYGLEEEQEEDNNYVVEIAKAFIARITKIIASSPQTTHDLSP